MPRPRIHIPLTKLDRWLEAASLALLFATWLTAILFYPNLPGEIPIHYNLAGAPDNFGPKGYVFLFPALATFLYLLLTVVNRYPHAFNYLQKVTEANAHDLYAGATRLLRFLKLGILLAMNISLLEIWRSTLAPEAADLIWLPWAMDVLILLPILIYLVRQLFSARSAG